VLFPANLWPFDTIAASFSSSSGRWQRAIANPELNQPRKRCAEIRWLVRQGAEKKCDVIRESAITRRFYCSLLFGMELAIKTSKPATLLGEKR
jgi:hypothetical protein